MTLKCTVGVNGGTGILNIGDSGSGGAGFVQVQKDSSISLVGASGHRAVINLNAFSDIIGMAGSTVTLGGTTTQTGAHIKSGSGAVTELREVQLPFPSNTSNHFDPSIGDVIYYSLVHGGPFVWTLDPPASGACVVVELRASSAVSPSGGDSTAVNDGNTGNTLFLFNSNPGAATGARIIYSPVTGRWSALTTYQGTL
jgi:hypothetical protein